MGIDQSRNTSEKGLDRTQKITVMGYEQTRGTAEKGLERAAAIVLQDDEQVAVAASTVLDRAHRIIMATDQQVWQSAEKVLDRANEHSKLDTSIDYASSTALLGENGQDDRLIAKLNLDYYKNCDLGYFNTWYTYGATTDSTHFVGLDTEPYSQEHPNFEHPILVPPEFYVNMFNFEYKGHWNPVTAELEAVT
jgi:hypothetical protein